jgi:hypothetical protein
MCEPLIVRLEKWLSKGNLTIYMMTIIYMAGSRGVGLTAKYSV